MVYKLVAVEDADGDEVQPSMKRSAGKATYPGPKQVSRVERDGTYREDVLATRGENVPGSDQLVTVFEDGERVYDLPDIEEIRRRARREIERLPPGVRAVRGPEPYPVRVGDGLQSLRESLEADLEARYARE